MLALHDFFTIVVCFIPFSWGRFLICSSALTSVYLYLPQIILLRLWLFVLRNFLVLITWLFKPPLPLLKSLLEITRKAIGFKSLQWNCLEINQATSKRPNWFFEQNLQVIIIKQKVNITIEFCIFEII